MTPRWALPQERCREELRAARELLDHDLPAQAVSRSWFAALHAASAALDAVGERPSSAPAVVSAFARELSGTELGTESGRALRRLYEDHRDVDHALAAPAPGDGERALADATRIVDDALRWIEQER